MTNVIGEDRSSFQAVTGWGGNSFGFAKATEGTGWSDPTFAANWANLREAGKVRGAYHFFHPADDPVRQARFFVGTVEAHGGFAPGDIAVADVEITVGADGLEDYGTARAVHRMHTGLKADAPRGLAAGSVGPGALRFLDAVRGMAGPHCRVLLYTDVFMAQNLLGACAGYPLFLAYYEAAPVVPAPWKNWTFWQNGAKSHAGGDVDYFNGDEAHLRAWASPAPRPLPPGWTYPPVQRLTAAGGETSVKLAWDAPAQPPGEAPLPGIGWYQVAVTPGPELVGKQLASYPRWVRKSVNPEAWQGGSLPRKTVCTVGVRAADESRQHAGEWATATFSTT